MVYFITGPVCSGKSTRLLSIYNSKNCGDGFYNIRRYIKNQYVGQDIVQMSTGKSAPFSRIEGCIPEGWDEMVCLYNYSFSRKGLEFAEKITDIILKTHMVAFVDELGPLELKGQGLYPCFNNLYKSNLDIYTVCRDSCIEQVFAAFEIKKYIILED